MARIVLMLEDGKPVGFSLVGDDYVLGPDEVFASRRPGAGERWNEATGELRPPTESEALTEAKVDKEQELRDAANDWYTSNIRVFEGAVVGAKYGRGGLPSLLPDEKTLFDAINANYEKLKTLVAQTRDATTVEQVNSINW